MRGRTGALPGETLRVAVPLLAGLLALAVTAAPPAEARTWRVPEDGFATIQAALDSAAANDSVVVAAGTYHESLLLTTPGVTLSGAGSGPGGTVIDPALNGRGLLIQARCRVTDLAIVNGRERDGAGLFIEVGDDVTIARCAVTACVAGETESGRGGGFFINFTSARVRVEQCVISDNSAGYAGGGLYSLGEGLRVTGCRIERNATWSMGGGVSCSGCSLAGTLVASNTAHFRGGGVGDAPLTLDGCTIVDNTVAESFLVGAGVDMVSLPGGHIDRCIVARNRSTGAPGGAAGILCSRGGLSDSVPISCTNSWGNDGPAFALQVADTTGRGNGSADPLFCAPSATPWALSDQSPCHDWGACGRIGSEAVACQTTPVRPMTWGALKALPWR